MQKNRIYFVYEVIIYWKDESKKIKSFYKIGHASSEKNRMCLRLRFDNEIYRGAKVFVINQIKFDTRKKAKFFEERLYKKALEINHSEFDAKYDSEIGIKADFGDFYDYPYYFGGSTEVLRTPRQFEKLIEKLNDFFEENPPIYYPKKLNKSLEKIMMKDNNA